MTCSEDFPTEWKACLKCYKLEKGLVLLQLASHSLLPIQGALAFISPSGKLVQIEYALAAVAAGAPSVGIKAANGVVLATEKKQKSILYDERSVHKVEPITKHIGLVYSGMGPDYRVLVHRARKLAQQYYLVYHEPIPTAQLVQRIASVMQEYTQSGYAVFRSLKVLRKIVLLKHKWCSSIWCITANMWLE
ncbi:proteasome subunit alpha type-2 isoform X4 [Apteryx rowi]|uniref:proteasome subunit alpha type-2 isoform X4 n=1 Tax=Apteryx rowi TaxID=308060 RepID=UPI000E1D60B8|nr:proteasome subunit alpha type-2 isoform X4 [Apteryx rowi]